jgi:hypothetical protein
MTIPNYESYKWDEVWEVTEWRGRCVYKTKPTGFHISNGTKLRKPYIAVSISVAKMQEPNIEINPCPQNFLE